MKIRQIALIALLLTIVFLVAACAPANSTFEGRKNRLEAFLVDRANGYDDVEPPNIYGLDDATKSELINGLAQDVVNGKEQILIDYLNEQWPDWRSADGFLISYLDGLVREAEKLVAVMPKPEMDLKQAVKAQDLTQFYRALDNMLSESSIERNALFVVADSLRYIWKYQDGKFFLQGVEMTLLDLTEEKFYQLKYDARQLSVQTADSKKSLYGHLSLDQTIQLLDEKAISTLLPAEISTPIVIEFKGAAGQLDQSVAVAIKNGASYLTQSELAAGQSVGLLTLRWQSDGSAPRSAYHLFLSQIID
ncbi:MAG: hypothetical protein CSB19_00175 [Clostridiales bacterium]|nr:MAG: hypothetical protein CSB19_00175 [Clostridiales bacterium]